MCLILKSDFEMPSYQGFGTLTTASGFIEHEKTVAKDKQKEQIRQ